MIPENFSRLEAIQQHFEDRKYADFGQDMDAIYTEMVDMNGWKSFSGKMMAEAKRDLNEAKVKAYNTLIASQRAVSMEIPPSIAKDYISAKCGELQYQYDFAERVNSNCAYGIDTMRSILSALKQEMATINYSG